jgi:hypothetical protein
MALPSSGPISSSMIQTEFGGSNPIAISEYYKGGANVPNTATNVNIPTSGQIKFSDFYNGSDLVSYEYLLGHGDNSTDACYFASEDFYYQAVDEFNFSQNLYSNSSLTTFANAEWYSNGFGTREWSGTAWLGGGAELCPL